ncbi:hypothetical protein [Streptococcus porcorum]
MGFLLLSLPFILMYIFSVEEKLKKMTKQIQKLEKSKKGEESMSKMLEELVGQKVKLIFDGIINTNEPYHILAVDEEWLKVSRVHKNGQEETRLVRIDTLQEVRWD